MSEPVSDNLSLPAVRFKAFTYVHEPFMRSFEQVGWLMLRPIYTRSDHMSWLAGWLCDCSPVKPRAS